MADETTKPTEPNPEEPRAGAAAPVTPPPAGAEPVDAPAAPPPPPAGPPAPTATSAADAVKQAEVASQQAGAAIDKAFQGQGGDQARLILAVVLSIFNLAWIGTIINGQVMKGIVLLLGWFVLGVVVRATFMLGFGLFGLYYLFLLVDTIMLALRVSKGEKLGEWDFFWKTV